MPTQTELLVANQTYVAMLDDPSMVKKAQDEASDYIRLKLREEGFSRKIIEPTELGEPDQAVWTDKPIKIFQKESDVPGSITVGYGNQPINFYIRPSKFQVSPTMLLTPKAMKHKWELRTYKYDVRQVFADNMVKDMQAMEDRALLLSVNAGLIGAGTNMPGSGVAQWQQVSGGFSRSSVVYACFKVLESTPYNIPTETCLVNNLTFADHLMWRRDEAGGDVSQDWLLKGWTESNLFNKNWLVSIKRGLVPTYTQFLFGPTKFLGKTVEFTPPTMYAEIKNIGMYTFFAAEEIGTVLVNTGAFGRVDYLAS